MERQSGDIDNPYIGSWNIYKLTVANSAGTVFPAPYPDFSPIQSGGNSPFDTHRLPHSPQARTSWIDPTPLPTGICASYAIMPADREGTPDFLHIEITRDEAGQPVAFCGDAVAPDKVGFTNMQVTQLTFTNDSECYKIMNDWSMCYDVNMTWVWPEQEATGDVTWNLYRTDQRPDGIDIAIPHTSRRRTDRYCWGERDTTTKAELNDENIRPCRTFLLRSRSCRFRGKPAA